MRTCHVFLMKAYACVWMEVYFFSVTERCILALIERYEAYRRLSWILLFEGYLRMQNFSIFPEQKEHSAYVIQHAILKRLHRTK